MKKIGVLIKEPSKKPRHVNISDSLANLQNTVGGYIETVTLASGVVVICNEEGRINGMDYNCNIAGVDFFGTVIMCGVDGEEFADLPISWDGMKLLFRDLWEV